ncbi:unnamed protein product, partial [marine sediment metagenome]
MARHVEAPPIKSEKPRRNKKEKLIQNSRSQMKKIIAIFDCHIPENIGLKGVLEFIKDEKPQHLILGGDIMNMNALSRWEQAGGKSRKLEGQRYDKEIRMMNEFL